MNGLKIISVKENKNRQDGYPAYTLLFLSFGVCGFLLFLHSLESVRFGVLGIWFVAAGSTIVNWYISGCRRKWFRGFLLAEGALCCIYVLIFQNAIRNEGSYIIQSLLRQDGLPVMDVTVAAVLAAFIFPVVFLFLEFILGCHWFLYLLTSALLLLSPLFGIRTDIKTVLVLFLFQVMFWTMTMTEKRKATFAGENKRRLKRNCSAQMGMILGAAFLISFVLVSFFSQGFYDSAYAVESSIYRTLTNLSGRSENPVTGGWVSRGNNYRTGTPQLKVKTDKEPEETMYLRGFSGGEYTGDGWAPSDDEVLFEEIAEKLDWQQWLSSIRGMYYNMYFTMNSVTGGEQTSEVREVTIRHTGGTYENVYVPYYGAYSRKNPYWSSDSWKEGYLFSYYEQKDMGINWDETDTDFETPGEWYGALQKAYMEEARKFYTQVTKEEIPRLASLVEENPMEDMEEITSFILYTLQTNASYTLTPGWMPYNKDVVEYFLFESHSGYCVHFASAAVLMYRLYGIPARYASGYAIAPSDFEQQEDGTWMADVTDESAHAWVEIFFEDYGWTPVEATPSTDGSMNASYPGIEGIEWKGLWEEQGWDISPASPTEAISESSPLEGSGYEQAFDFSAFTEKYGRLITACIFYSVLLTPVLLNYRRRFRLRKIKGMNCRQIFTIFTEMLHFQKLLPDYDGSEEDFPKKVAEAVPSVRESDISGMQQIVKEAAFGQDMPKEEAVTAVKGIYFHTADALYKELNWHEKLIFRYWKNFN